MGTCVSAPSTPSRHRQLQIVAVKRPKQDIERRAATRKSKCDEDGAAVSASTATISGMPACLAGASARAFESQHCAPCPDTAYCLSQAVPAPDETDAELDELLKSPGARNAFLNFMRGHGTSAYLLVSARVGVHAWCDRAAADTMIIDHHIYVWCRGCDALS